MLRGNSGSVRAVIASFVFVPVFCVVFTGCDSPPAETQVPPAQQQVDANKNMEDFMNKQAKEPAKK
ncbi:MAG: hypothetical protein SFX72_06035 [Isosphaeraceae bacterium]|jgi:hypothetical protein|nr:hypothetical protein [Isosphaeraceae bacterium]